VLGIILAVVALVQTRDGRRRGRGLAVGGLAASLVWVVLLAVGGLTAQRIGNGLLSSPPAIDEQCPDDDCPWLTSGPTIPSSDGSTTPSDEPPIPRAKGRNWIDTLRRGDCLATVPASLQDDADGSTVKVVSCAKPHRAEVYRFTTVGADEYYPEPGDIQRTAELQCSNVPDEARADIRAGRARVVYAYPGPAAWAQIRLAACMLVTPAPRRTTYLHDGTDPPPAPSPPAVSPTPTVPRATGRNWIETLARGDCLATLPASLRDDADDGHVREVDCAAPHLAEVYHFTTVGVGPYPPLADIQREAELQCGIAVPDSSRADLKAGRARFVYAYPGPAAWAQTRRAACLLVTPTPRRTTYLHDGT
jgi:hypothetical protein